MKFVLGTLEVRCLLLFGLEYLDGARLVVCEAQLPSDCGKYLLACHGLVVADALIEHGVYELRLLVYIVRLVVALCKVFAKQLVLLRHVLPSCED